MIATYRYDEWGNVTEVAYPNGGEKHILYGPENQPETITLPSGSSIAYAYDGERLTDQMASDGVENHFTYYADGRVHTVENSDTGTITYTYTAHATRTDYPNGSAVTFAQNGLGQVIQVIVQASEGSPEYVTQHQYDGVGNLERVTDPYGGETTFVYDAANRLIERSLPNGVVTTFQYDLRDRITDIVHRVGATDTVLASFHYDRSK